MTPMKYAVISTDGDLSHHEGDIDWDAVIGVEGQVRVRLRQDIMVCGWVNDVGLRFPERFPRNAVATCVLASLGASVQPYAGPVVFTGWDSRNTRKGLVEICSLPDPVDVLDTIHGGVLKALAGQTPRDLSPSWAESMREIAEHARTAPAPTLTIRSVTLR
ncbi:hypothetical protein ACFYRN_25255 [Streptomyces sp. NPDC005227]|uniref:hypothetical protein n=1 Tax=Streptomyces sp. NPDC005227 TaxID=3364707 RepID=UPI0036CE0421